MVSYKNSDVIPTVRDCIEKSVDRDNLHFGLCLQQDEEVPSELDHPRIKVHRVSCKDSLGHGWARLQAQSLYDGQDYVMQVDSGSRFAAKWDEDLIKALGETGSAKPLITNCPNKYNPANNEMEHPGVAYKNQVHQFISEAPMSWASPMKNITSIIRARLISESFFFTKGEHSRECLYDPDIYYSELNSALTVRSFCLGYDIFSHFRPFVWKDYANKPWNWNDDPDWWLKDHASKKRFVSLLDNNVPAAVGLGNVRTIRDFELYSGIDMKGRRIQRSALTGNDPPGKYDNEEQWNNEYLKDNVLTVAWDINEIEKCDDYDYWYFSIEDAAEATIFRQDLRVEQDANLMNFQSNFKKIYFKSVGNKTPKRLCIHPVSKSKGWLKKVKFDL